MLSSFHRRFKERNQSAINGHLGDNGLAALRHVEEKEQLRGQERAYPPNGEEMTVRPTPKLKQKIVIQILVQVTQYVCLNLFYYYQ